MIPAVSKQKASVMSLSTVDERQALDDEYNEVRPVLFLIKCFQIYNCNGMGTLPHSHAIFR